MYHCVGFGDLIIFLFVRVVFRVMFDKHLKMCEHVNLFCREAQFILKKISDVRNCLSVVTTEHLTHAHVTSQLDSCNTLLYGLSNVK